jgi:hypothetical protein
MSDDQTASAGRNPLAGPVRLRAGARVASAGHGVNQCSFAIAGGACPAVRADGPREDKIVHRAAGEGYGVPRLGELLVRFSGFDAEGTEASGES